MIQERASGILLHPTSFPSPDGIGDLGPEAYRWIDFLKASGTQLWQILPLGPTGYGDSPYQCFSAFAGNPFLISPLLLLDEGLLTLNELADRPAFPQDRVDFGPVIIWKNALLDRAYAHFRQTRLPHTEMQFLSFRTDNQSWLDDFSLFMAIKESQDGRPWGLWPHALKFRQSDALRDFAASHAEAIEKQKFNQFLFFSQWERLRGYAHANGIQIVGDIPFVVALDSSDVWATPEMFLMDAELNPSVVAGVPPDYFSRTGQLWGNPLYQWEAHKSSGYKWWLDRFAAVFKLVDMVRLDHFRGFAAAWQVPYGNTTAEHGKWVPGPAGDLFTVLNAAYPQGLPIIAEDLGVITPDVQALRDDFNLPGMKILQFAFTGDPEDDFLPHHYPVNCFAYTGSHDNNTVLGWYHAASEAEKDFCRRYLSVSGNDISWSMMRAVWSSVALAAVAPMQDVLSLGEESRMNLPGSESGNWGWRMKPNALSDQLRRRLWELNLLYSRLPLEERRRFTEKLNGSLGDSVKPH